MNRYINVVRAAAVTAGFLAISACSTDTTTPTAPTASASAGLLSPVTGLVGGLTTTVGTTVNGAVSLLKVPVVTRNQALASDVVVTQSIGAAGGTISIPAANVTIVFAPGAVTSPTVITVTAYAGTALAFGFAPHGITFKAPVTFTVGLANTNVANHPEWAPSLQGGYTPDGLLDLDGLGYALVSELNAATAVLNPSGTTITSASFNIPHFSGYILAGGRSADSDME